jgi:hypothetical protein
MPNNHPINDPRNVWQNQPPEPLRISLDEIRRRAGALEVRARREVFASYAVAAFLVIAFSRASITANGMLPKIAFGMMAAWAIYFLIMVRKGIWPHRLPPDAAPLNTIAIYKRELERQRDHLWYVWKRLLVPLFLMLALLLVPLLLRNPRLAVNVVPFFVLLALWVALFVPVRRRKLRAIQRELAELDELRNENVNLFA